MNGRQRLSRVTGHEFRVTAANKGFVITTIIGPFLILAVALLPMLGTQAMMDSELDEEITVALVAGEAGLGSAVRDALGEAGISVREMESMDGAREAVAEGEMTAAVDLGPLARGEDAYAFVGESGIDMRIPERVERVVGEAVTHRRMLEAGYDPEEIAAVTERPEMRRIRPDATAEEGDPFLDAFVTAFAFVFLIYMSVIFYGQMIGRSALTERTSKTVEIMLSSVTPLELMFGKVFGKGVAGLLQYAFWIGLGLFLSSVVAPQFDIRVPDALTAGNLALLLVFFLGAFLLYAMGYAAIGAGSSDEQHMGQLGMPLLVMLIVPMVLISPIITAPDSTLTVALSIFPFTAPIVMLVRITVGSPPVAQVFASIGLLGVTIAGMGFLSARIFRMAVLAGGGRIGFRDLLRYLRA